MQVYNKQETPEEVGNEQKALEEACVPENNEISISYLHKVEKMRLK